MSRRRPTLRLASALALGSLLLPVFGASVVAADDAIGVEVRALVAGRFEAGGWAALSVSLANDGAPVTGYLTAESEDGIVRRFVELPGGSRKVVPLYLRPAAFARTIEVTLTDEGGTSLGSGSVEVRVLERTTGHTVVVGDPAGALRPQLISRGAGFPDPVLLGPADFPERPEPLRGIETIIWAADSSAIGESQRRALERWIASGGQLLVLGGPDWQARTAAFADLLPVSGLAAVDGTSVATLATWAGSDAPAGLTGVTAAIGTLREGALALVRGADGELLAAAVTSGAGRVSWVAVDLATEPFRAWTGAPVFWSRLIPDDRLIQQFGGFGIGDEEIASMMTQALANLPALDVPPAELVLGVIVGYILLIGPISYLVLRRVDRRDLAWVTAPLLVLVFSACSYGLGYAMKGSSVIVNQIAVVRTTSGGSTASVSTYAGIFSPSRATYDLTARGDALFSALQYTGFDPAGNPIASQYATEQGDPAHLRGLAVSVFGLQGVRAEAVIPYTPSLHLEWASGRSSIEGRVTNDGPTPVEDVAIISRSGGLMIGTLAPGESKTFLMSTANASGSTASDQVYGFVNWEVTTEAQRQVLIRRQVIDALVGYGGFSGRPDVVIGIDRGPFVIGWHPDATPVGIEVDRETPQVYAQAVEVLSGRPQFGPGEVRIAASQLGNEIAEVVGEANQGEPGYVTLANGEVTFRVSLPLEATGLQPSKMTLIAGNDPGIIFYDQENFGGILPAGYRISAYNHDAGEWVDVGDLSLASRFELTDPGPLIDDGGRVLIKITGTNIAPAVGQVPVFASAVIEGVMAP